MSSHAILPTRIPKHQPLSRLAKDIDKHHAAVQTAIKGMVRHDVAAGQGLIEAKVRVPHGSWQT